MLKKTIKYTDYNGVEREEEMYFNLSKAEVAMLTLSTKEGYGEMLQRIVKEEDTKRIAEVFSEQIGRAHV